MEQEKKEERFKKAHQKILDYLKKVPVASTTNIAFNIRDNYLWVKRYLGELEKMGLIEQAKEYRETLKNFTFWRIKKNETDETRDK